MLNKSISDINLDKTECLICSNLLNTLKVTDAYHDYDCYKSNTEHYFGIRISAYSNLMMIRTRSRENGLYIRVNYLLDNSEMWASNNSLKDKYSIKLHSIVE